MIGFRFSVCHPTARIRPEDPLWWGHSCKAFWDRCDHPELVEYVLCIHESNWDEYQNTAIRSDIRKVWGEFKVVKNFGPNRSLSQGNAALGMAAGEIIIGSMDDLFPPKHWDELILDALDSQLVDGPTHGPAVLHVSSGSPGDYRTFIPQIFTQAYYKSRLGNVIHPDYWSMYADCEFTEVAVRDHVAIEAPHIQFQHKHFSFGTAQMDSVYAETNSKEAFEHDWGVFMRRRAAGFPIQSLEDLAGVGEFNPTGPIVVPEPFDPGPSDGFINHFHLPTRHTSRKEGAGKVQSTLPEQTGSTLRQAAPEHRGGRPLFSILHTSSRPHKWRAVHDDWMSKATRPEDVEYVLCADHRWKFDVTDVDLEDAGYGSKGQFQCIWNDTPYKYSGYVSGVNRAAKAATGQILIVVADDQFACEGWDEAIRAILDQTYLSPRPSGDHFVIEVSTNTVNEHERGIFVMPILSRARYEHLGYVFYPAYESMYADNDLCEEAQKDGVVIDARHLVFPHGHPLIPIESGQLDMASAEGQAHLREAWDRSYQAQHQDGAYQLGKFVLDRRRANAFTDLQCSICQAKFGDQHAPSCRRTGEVEILLSGETGAPGSRTIAWCLPFQNCSAGWFVAALDLYHHMQASGFNVIVTNAQSSECFVSREVIRKAVMSQTSRADFLLWQDSDNLISPAQFDMLMQDLASYPDLMMVSGWYRLTPGSEGKVSTCVAHLVDGEMRMVDEQDLLNAAGLVDTQWHGFGGVLMRYEVLEKVGDKPFAPLPAPNSPYGVTGEDTAFCMRARQAGCKIAIDPRVFLPHLKLGELGPRPRQGVSTIPEAFGTSSLSVQTMVEQAKKSVQTMEPTVHATDNRLTENEFHDSNAGSLAGTSTFPRVHACLRIKNEGRWIARILRSLRPLCSRIWIIDNGSTDNTLEEIQEVRRDGKERIDFVQPTELRNDEGHDRQTLLEFAREAGADWILNIDGDEELGFEAAVKIAGVLCRQSTDIQAWCLKVEYLWNSPDQIRVDRWYEGVWMPRLFRVTPTLSFASIRNGIHTQTGGLDSRMIGGIPAAPLWHYGYALKSDRLAKWRFYNSIDPNNDAEDRYRHIVQGDLPSIPASATLKMAGPLELRKIANGPAWSAEDWAKLTGPIETPQNTPVQPLRGIHNGEPTCVCENCQRRRDEAKSQSPLEVALL